MSGRDENFPHTDGEHTELWVRPYTATNGRTRPSTTLDLMSQVKATGRGTIAEQWLGIEHTEVLQLCRVPRSVAEVSAQLRQPVIAAKVLLSDLVESGAVVVRAPTSDHEYTNSPEVLEALIVGLKRL
ncbi:DUF742 domain-containing protein [Saccharomonospora iraqiensis]|uniref:DUF742 domain-containing protein n=1 Tax=Saccharomonospora iraqiensis TaxID=52698 RepID=UPI0005575167|nr:DUF742 domain-containing protein [Saccharomonospora iraqiensis]